MSFPKKFTQVALAIVVGLVVAASGLGPGFTSATAAVPLTAFSFVVQEPVCGQLALSFDYDGGPGDWSAKRDADNGGPTIASGSVTTGPGNVSNEWVTGIQPAGTYAITLYDSSSGTEIARSLVTVYDTATCQGQIEGTNFVVVSPSCGTITASFDYVGGPDSWTIERNPLEESVQVAGGSVANATGSVQGVVVTGQPAGINEYALYGSRGGKPAASRAIVTVAPCTAQPTSVTPTPPTSTDLAGTTNDTYTVPSKVGVNYLVGGVATATGTFPGTGSVTITAAPKSGYVLAGTTAWTFQFTDAVTSTSVTPTPPTFTDKAGAADDTYTVPSMVGVEYSVGGVVKAAGTYPGSGSVTITAAPNSGYLLNGTTAWTFRFTNVVPTQATTTTTNSSPVVASPVVDGQSALNPGFGAKTGWGEDASTQRGNTLNVALALAMAGLAGLAYYVRRKTG